MLSSESLGPPSGRAARRCRSGLNRAGQGSATVTDLLNEAPESKFHRRTVIISGVGFFTDAYDLFVIGTVADAGGDAVAP